MNYTIYENPKTLVCDFCSSPEIYGSFDCADFSTQITPGFGTTSNGGWAACRTCYDLVAADRWNDLLERSVLEFSKKYGVRVDGVRSHLASMHQQFRTLRKPSC